MYWDILDEKRKNILPKLALLKEESFYLAGGTGLALILGHRDSIDFDFFRKEDINTTELFKKLLDIFGENSVVKTQEENNTLSVIIHNEIRLSFFSFPYELIYPLLTTEFFEIADIGDIASMKLNAITGRSVFKDYVDLYFILKEKSLNDLILDLQKKMPELDSLLVLKSLVYFEDIIMEPIFFKTTPVSLEEIKKDFIKKVEERIKINQN